jgi:hypothetical protein
MPVQRLENLRRFYSILDELKVRLGGYRRLATADGRLAWPQRGIYFFFEPGEQRSNSGFGRRVVRVGTHALTLTSRTTLWGRLSQHRGVAITGGGNHRGSVFRKHIGYALMGRTPELDCPTWGERTSAPRAVREREHYLELMVTEVIGQMPFLWLDVGEIKDGHRVRGYLERHPIALLSNYGKPPVDPPSPTWLGSFCRSERVKLSGLWLSDYVDEAYDPIFLDRMEQQVRSGIGFDEKGD